jgi:hypothetical protein
LWVTSQTITVKARATNDAYDTWEAKPPVYVCRAPASEPDCNVTFSGWVESGKCNIMDTSTIGVRQASPFQYLKPNGDTGYIARWMVYKTSNAWMVGAMTSSVANNRHYYVCAIYGGRLAAGPAKNMPIVASLALLGGSVSFATQVPRQPTILRPVV